MRRYITPLFVAAALLVPALALGHGKTAAKQTLNDADKDFVIKAYQGNLAEVKLGQLAESHAQSAAVKSFGERMVKDHGKAVDQLKALATRKSVALPSDIASDQQKTYDDLAKLSGADFDKAYMDQMMKDHDQDVSDFQNEAKSAKDKDIRSLANKMLPTLKSHQKMAHSGGGMKHM